MPPVGSTLRWTSCPRPPRPGRPTRLPRRLPWPSAVAALVRAECLDTPHWRQLVVGSLAVSPDPSQWWTTCARPWADGSTDEVRSGESGELYEPDRGRSRSDRDARHRHLQLPVMTGNSCQQPAARPDEGGREAGGHASQNAGVGSIHSARMTQLVAPLVGAVGGARRRVAVLDPTRVRGLPAQLPQPGDPVNCGGVGFGETPCGWDAVGLTFLFLGPPSSPSSSPRSRC
jgi:hypothetical protein